MEKGLHVLIHMPCSTLQVVDANAGFGSCFDNFGFQAAIHPNPYGSVFFGAALFGVD